MPALLRADVGLHGDDVAVGGVLATGCLLWDEGLVARSGLRAVLPLCGEEVTSFQKNSATVESFSEISPCLNANPRVFLIAWFLLIGKPGTPHWRVCLAASKPKVLSVGNLH